MWRVIQLKEQGGKLAHTALHTRVHRSPPPPSYLCLQLVPLKSTVAGVPPPFSYPHPSPQLLSHNAPSGLRASK